MRAPECSLTASDNKVTILQYELRRTECPDEDSARFREYLYERAAREFIPTLIKQGFIEFTDVAIKDPMTYGVTRTTRARLAVCSTAAIKSLEARINERQMEIAEKLAADLCARFET